MAGETRVSKMKSIFKKSVGGGEDFAGTVSDSISKSMIGEKMSSWTKKNRGGRKRTHKINARTHKFRGGEGIANRASRLGSNVANLAFTAISSKNTYMFLRRMDKSFKRAYRMVTEERFNELDKSYNSGVIDKEHVIDFFKTMTWSTFMMMHFSCSTFSNFLSMKYEELVFIVIAGPAAFGMQSLTCFVSLALIITLLANGLCPRASQFVSSTNEEYKNEKVKEEREIAEEKLHL